MKDEIKKVMEYAKSKKQGDDDGDEPVGAKLLKALKDNDADAAESAISAIVDKCMEDYD